MRSFLMTRVHLARNRVEPLGDGRANAVYTLDGFVRGDVRGFVPGHDFGQI